MPAALLVLSTGSAQATPAARAGSPGEVTTTFGPKSDDVAQALVLQRDGKIVVVGYRSPGGEDSEFALARYRPNGTLDSSFGTGGKVTTAFGFANAAALEPDGRIVAVGGILVNRPDFDFALARYTASGALDSSFGSGGKVTTTFGPTADLAQALALQPDGRIVVAGSSGFPQQRDDAFALARYDANGTLDSGFGAGGRVTTRFTTPGDDTARAVFLQPDGKIVAVGSNFVAAREGSSDFALARYDARGVLDRSFGSGGKVTTSFGTGSDFANAGVLQPDGKLVAAGYTYVGGVAGRSYFALARYGVDGALDESFGSARPCHDRLRPGRRDGLGSRAPTGRKDRRRRNRPGRYLRTRPLQRERLSRPGLWSGRNGHDQGRAARRGAGGGGRSASGGQGGRGRLERQLHLPGLRPHLLHAERRTGSERRLRRQALHRPGRQAQEARRGRGRPSRAATAPWGRSAGNSPAR